MDFIKVELEEYYMNNKSFALDCKIIFLTIKQLLFPSNISHKKIFLS